MAIKKVKKPLFYFEALTPWDIVAIWLYALITVVFVFSIYSGYEHIIKFLIFYTLVNQMGNFLLNYLSLANLKSYFIWLGFGFIHLMLYFILRGNPMYNGARGLLLNTIILMILYQILRLINRKVQGQELGLPMSNYKDLFTNRQITFLDVLLGITYFACFAALNLCALTGKY